MVMETLLEAGTRLRGDGYDVDFSATTDVRLHCSACGVANDPTGMTIDEIVRYEGISNPDDEAILLALRCDCGRRGLYVAGFGPSASVADAAVLVQMP